MSLRRRLAGWLFQTLLARVALAREPDFVIGPRENSYLRRWHLIPKNRFIGLYLHHIRKSDDDRALHDHPFLNVSFLLAGGYVEHSIAAGGIHRRRARETGAIVPRGRRAAHRLEIVGGRQCWSLFFTAFTAFTRFIRPGVAHWGFHCPQAGWRHWTEFTDAGDPGRTGKGCGE